MTFAFDERYAMFDITPVENQFILEYMPGAKGDYVKVYLYGLLCCYHPRKEMDVASMSRELGMTEDVILAAYRYWERRGIVRRVSDNPPEWQYVNIKQNRIRTGNTSALPVTWKAASRTSGTCTAARSRCATNGRKSWD